jgi:hypothetical protein
VTNDNLHERSIAQKIVLEVSKSGARHSSPLVSNRLRKSRIGHL